jgi:hypothetical protein
VAETYTIEATLDPLQASLNIGTSISVVGKLPALQAKIYFSDVMLLLGTLDGLKGSISVVHDSNTVIVGTLGALKASFFAEEQPNVLVAATLSPLKAAFEISAGKELQIATTLDALVASISMVPGEVVVFTGSLDELKAAMVIDSSTGCAGDYDLRYLR